MMYDRKGRIMLSEYAAEIIMHRYKRIPPMPYVPNGADTDKDSLAARLIFERVSELSNDEVDLMVRKYLTVVVG